MRGREFLLGMVLALTSGVLPAVAGLGVIPKPIESEPPRSWFVYTLVPGESKEDVLLVSNSSDQSQLVVIEALDGVSTEDGVYSLVSSPEENQNVGKWFDFEQKELTLRPNSSNEIRFRVTVPKDAPVGEHSGGLVAYAKPVSGPTGSIPVTTRVGARVYVTVPGKVIRDIEFKEFKIKMDGRNVELQAEAINRSNINIVPTVELGLRGLFGGKKVTLNLVRPYIPGSNMVFGQKWPDKLWPFGFYRAEAVIHTNTAKEYAMDKTSTDLPDQVYRMTKSFWVGLEWLWLILGLAAIAWAFYRYIIYRRAVHKYRIFYESHVIGANESLEKIAEQYGVLPEDIIRFNGLRRAKAIKAGFELMVPKRTLTAAELRGKAKYHRPPSYWRYLLSFK